MRDDGAIELFLEMMAVERGAADNTLAAYARDLALAGEGTSLVTASTADIRALLERLAGRGYAASSQARTLSALRQFYRFLYAEGLRADDPTGPVAAPRRGRPLPKVMGVDEVDRLLATAQEEAERAGCEGRDQRARAGPQAAVGPQARAGPGGMSRLPTDRRRCGCTRWSNCSTRRACASPSSSRWSATRG